MRLYVIFDKLADEAGPVFEAKNDKVAYRQFMNSMPDNIDQADFDLRCVGKIDKEKCFIMAHNEYQDVKEQLEINFVKE